MTDPSFDVATLQRALGLIGAALPPELNTIEVGEALVMGLAEALLDDAQRKAYVAILRLLYYAADVDLAGMGEDPSVKGRLRVTTEDFLQAWRKYQDMIAALEEQRRLLAEARASDSG